jgi:hypothetical protein
MKELWQISRGYRKSRWVGVCPTLQLTVEADTLPELRESIHEAEGALNSFIWAMDDSDNGRFVDLDRVLYEPPPDRTDPPEARAPPSQNNSVYRRSMGPLTLISPPMSSK